MKLIKNKYVSLGMMFLILAIILNVASNVNDLFVGMLYGISLGILILGLLSTQNACVYAIDNLSKRKSYGR